MPTFAPFYHYAICAHQTEVLRNPWPRKLEAIYERVDVFFTVTQFFDDSNTIRVRD